ncbi:AAA family ATPase [Planococcus chinensis]|uniref:ATP-binding protein n=1 Tax=Planococcus chinensis TaxID=272917 RepID=A0ABW4QIA4_9BACL
MKLTRLKLKNFRGYDNIEVNFNENLNVIIGKNDVGKSTILDAMNSFFNDEIKLEPADCNKNATEKVIEISASFRMTRNENFLIDATNPTTLGEEYLLNEDGLLEIRKVINAGNKTIGAKDTKVEIICYHPKIYEQPFILYTIADLRRILKENESIISNYDEINKSKKADIRKALFNALMKEDTEFIPTIISLNNIQEDNMKSWIKIRENLPLFNLFQSDRVNSDGDKEIQDPMKAITKEVLSSLQPELDIIRDKVVSKVEEIGNKTIEKLKDFNGEIANQLKTLPDLKAWDSVFKFNLDTDDEIPLNKRGSGVRRLILLSYFRAQAEKNTIDHSHSNIIYAIEEPETAQHPDYQRMIIDTLKEISQQESSQVFITTHTPEIAQMVEKDSLIMISKNEYKKPFIVQDEQLKIQEIVSTLGILPTVFTRMVICLEGRHDINFLKNINNSIPEFKEMIDLSHPNISLYELGGSKLIDWININHFKESNIKEFHLYDGDIKKYKDLVDKMNTDNDGRRFGIYTERREMENYIPIQLIETEFNCDLSSYINIWEEFDVSSHLEGQLVEKIKDKKSREQAVKGILNSRLAQLITTDLLIEHGVYDEMKTWFEKMKVVYEGSREAIQVKG